MRPHTLDEMSTIILIFCRDGANKIELIEKCYLNDIESHYSRPQRANVITINTIYLHTKLFSPLHNLSLAIPPHMKGPYHMKKLSTSLLANLVATKRKGFH